MDQCCLLLKLLKNHGSEYDEDIYLVKAVFSHNHISKVKGRTQSKKAFVDLEYYKLSTKTNEYELQTLSLQLQSEKI